MARAVIRVLGAWRIETPLGYTDVSSPVERALLLTLATARDRGVGCRRLIRTAWGERMARLSDPTNALQHAIGRLRAKCGPDGAELIQYLPDDRRYRLDADTDEVDYFQFLTHRQAASWTDTGDDAVVAAAQAAGLQLWTTGIWSEGLPQGPTMTQIIAAIDHLRGDLLSQHLRLITTTGTTGVTHLPLPQIVRLLAAETYWPPSVMDAFTALLGRADDGDLAHLMDVLIRPRTDHPHSGDLFAAVLDESKRRAG